MYDSCNNCPAMPTRPNNCGSCTGDFKSTKFYHLPLWRANDVTSWMVGINTAMEKIDLLFHDFALRTGVDEIPQDVILAVSNLESDVNCLLKWKELAVKDLAGTTKVVADMLGQIDLIQEKLRTVNFNYANLDVRVKSIEQQFCSTGADMAKLLETIYSLQSKQEELEKKVDGLINPPEEPNPPESGGDGESESTGEGGANNG